jgi:glycosyltransferase involved in cell wall biosynthesis
VESDISGQPTRINLDLGPRTAVVVPCYNGRRFLATCLKSIRNLRRGPVEVVVVDDGSTEEIADVVEEVYPEARYIRQTNQGPGAARNRGLAETSAPYVRFLDCDDYLLPTSALQGQVAVLDGWPDVGLIYGQSVKVDEGGRPIGRRRPPFASASYIRSGFEELFYLLFGNYITTSGALVRRSVIEAAGGFRTDIIGPEDWDCWLRIAGLSSVAYLAEPVVAYRVHEQSITARYDPKPWLRMHFDILGRAFAHPEVGRRYGQLRPDIEAGLYFRAANLAYMAGDMAVARRHALRCVAATRRADLATVLINLGLIARTLVPSLLRRPVRRVHRQFQALRAQAIYRQAIAR